MDVLRTNELYGLVARESDGAEMLMKGVGEAVAARVLLSRFNFLPAGADFFKINGNTAMAR